jgi:pSer/pThr/pTyr-binding forkhead associated (FHA) protein
MVKTIGQETSAEINVTGVSREHARITVDSDRVTIEDLESKNGTRGRGHLVMSAGCQRVPLR